MLTVLGLSTIMPEIEHLNCIGFKELRVVILLKITFYHFSTIVLKRKRILVSMNKLIDSVIKLIMKNSVIKLIMFSNKMHEVDDIVAKNRNFVKCYETRK